MSLTLRTCVEWIENFQEFRIKKTDKISHPKITVFVVQSTAFLLGGCLSFPHLDKDSSQFFTLPLGAQVCAQLKKE